MRDRSQDYCYRVHTDFDRETGVIRAMLNDAVIGVIRTHDEQVRQTLIALGWTPPRDEDTPTRCKICGRIADKTTDVSGFFCTCLPLPVVDDGDGG